MNGRRDSLFRGADGGNVEEAGCGVTSSPSNTTNLSGNDYVEVTATGELRSLNKRGEASSSSLDKHASLKRKNSKGGTAPVKEERDHQYDNLAARDQKASPRHNYDNKKVSPRHNYDKKKASPGHHYDNLLSAKGDASTVKVSIEEGDRKEVSKKGRKSAAGEAAGEASDFLEFFDNMEQKKGSLSSLTRYFKPQ